MQAILFPITYISETVCAAVRTCFQPVRIYQPTRRQVPLPLQALSQKGLIDISIPAEDDDKKIEILVREYRNWVERHQGGVLEYLKQQRGSTPFFDDTATTQIKAQIKDPVRALEADDPLLNARVFLKIAQEYDLQSEEITRTLRSMNQAETNLFRNIIGAPEGSDPSAWRSQTKEEMDSTGYMIQPRILAWARLFLQDAAFDPAGAPTAFVTVHREALDFLMEQAPAADPILKVASLPVISHLSEIYENWQNSLARILDSLPDNAGTLAADLITRFQGIRPLSLKADLTLYRIPGEPPSLFFGRCIDQAPSKPKRSLPEERDYTLIGFVETGSRLKAEGLR